MIVANAIDRVATAGESSSTNFPPDNSNFFHAHFWDTFFDRIVPNLLQQDESIEQQQRTTDSSSSNQRSEIMISNIRQMISNIRQCVQEQFLTITSNVSDNDQNTMSLFTIVWETYSLLILFCNNRSEPITTILVMISSATASSPLQKTYDPKHLVYVQKYQYIICLLVLETCCSCNNQYIPVSSARSNVIIDHFKHSKKESPFFKMLVQGAFTVLQMQRDSHASPSIATAPTITPIELTLQYIELYLLEDMLGTNLYNTLIDTIYNKENIVTSLPDPLRMVVNRIVQQHSTSFLTTSTPSYKRPLPPPSLPLLGYDEDDYVYDVRYYDEVGGGIGVWGEEKNGEGGTDVDLEQSDYIDYVHAEMIWCVPICNRLLLLPNTTVTNITNNKNQVFGHKDARYIQATSIIKNQALYKPVPIFERRLVIEFLQHQRQIIVQSAKDQTLPSLQTILQMIRDDCSCTPQTLTQLVEQNPEIANECMSILVVYFNRSNCKNDDNDQYFETIKNEYLAALADINSIHQQKISIIQDQAYNQPLLPNERRIAIDFLHRQHALLFSTAEHSSVAETTMLQLILKLIQRDCKCTPQTLPRLIEHNPLVAYECLLIILLYNNVDDSMMKTNADEIDYETIKNDYLSSLVGMDMSLHCMEVMNRLAMYHIVNKANTIEQQATTNSSVMIRKNEPLLHPEYIHLFIGRCIASCEDRSHTTVAVQEERYVQNRLVRLICVFIQSLLRNHIIEPDDIYYEVQSFCIEFSRVREASALYKLLQQNRT